MARANPGVRFPPPFIFIAGFGVALWLRRWLPLTIGGGIVRPLVGWILVGAGLALTFTGMWTFMRARTSILPHHAASRLVTSGPYRRSRNPMYGGLSLAYCGGALLVDSLWPVLFLPLVLWTLYRTVVRREEAYLSDAFGAEYDEYRRRVRRWI